MNNKKGKILELVIYSAVLAAVILLSVFGKMPKPEKPDTSALQNTIPSVERVQ